MECNRGSCGMPRRAHSITFFFFEYHCEVFFPSGFFFLFIFSFGVLFHLFCVGGLLAGFLLLHEIYRPDQRDFSGGYHIDAHHLMCTGRARRVEFPFYSVAVSSWTAGDSLLFRPACSTHFPLEIRRMFSLLHKRRPADCNSLSAADKMFK